MATMQLERSPRLEPAVQDVLGRLRARIRRYVWTEGLAAMAAWLGLAFWLSLAIDWLLEPPVAGRVLIALAVAAVLAVIFVRFIGRRAFVPLSDSSMATLLERRFDKFNDSLLTTVVLTRRAPGDGGYSPDMLLHTSREASERIAGTQLSRVFDPLPRRRKATAAVALALSVAAFAVAMPWSFGIWVNRSLLMGSELWPRSIRLEADPAVFKYEDGRVARVAKGSDLDVIIRAYRCLEDDYEVAYTNGEATVVPAFTADEAREWAEEDLEEGVAVESVEPLIERPLAVPGVELRYRIEGGQRGRFSMNRLGERQDGELLQQYTYTFRGILSPIHLDVAGGDARLPDLRIEVVENPVILDKDTVLEEEFPAYMDRPTKRVPTVGTMQVPLGTRVTLHARSNKALQRVRIEVPADDKMSSRQVVLAGDELSEDHKGFSYRLEPLRRDTTLYISLLDVDGINSREAWRLPLAAVQDEPPQVGVRLAGIGTHITPQARLPAAGEITDDYGLEKAWFEYAVNQAPPATLAIPAKEEQRKAIASQHPTRYKLPEKDKVPEIALEAGDLKLAPKHKLLLSVKAADRCALDLGKDGRKGPNVGSSERWLLDVVTADELRGMLEARQVVLRQRFEGIIQEVEETHTLLARMTFDDAGPAKPAAGKDAAKPGEKPSALAKGAEPGEEPARKEKLSPQEQLARRLERIVQTLENNRKNMHETLGVAEAFDDIHQQYVNNRIPGEDEELRKRVGKSIPELKNLMLTDIIEPLYKLGQEMFPESEGRLERLSEAVKDPNLTTKQRQQAREQAEKQVVNILLAMNTVLEKMIKRQDILEIIAHLRNIIDLQEKLNKKTEEERKKAIRGLLEDK